MDLTVLDLLVDIDFQRESFEDHQDLTPHVQEGGNDNGEHKNPSDIFDFLGCHEGYEVINAVHHNRQR